MDDDVYVRGVALLDVLSSFDPSKELNIAAGPSLSGYSAGCPGPLAPFLQRKPWQVVSGLSAAAVQAVEPGVRVRGASRQCDALGLPGHDNGLGVFYWMYGIDSILLAPRTRHPKGATHAHALAFAGHEIFVEAFNLTEPQIQQFLDDSSCGPDRPSACGPMQHSIARFLFFHNARPPLALFKFLRDIADDEAVPFKTITRFNSTGFHCSKYVKNNDLRHHLDAWVDLDQAECAKPLSPGPGCPLEG